MSSLTLLINAIGYCLAKIDTLIGKGARIITRLKDALAREMLTGSGMPVVIDCCPFLGILSINAMAAADGVLVPIAAEYLAMKGAAKVMTTTAHYL